jgi:hypothetical protein
MAPPVCPRAPPHLQPRAGGDAIGEVARDDPLAEQEVDVDRHPGDRLDLGLIERELGAPGVRGDAGPAPAHLAARRELGRHLRSDRRRLFGDGS